MALSPVPDRRYLPALPAPFSLAEHEALPQGLARLTVGQLDDAIVRLVRGEHLDEAVHEVRKSLKRLRAVLRLVRREIGGRVFRVEDGELREIGRMLAPLRDGHVALHAVEHLRATFSDQLRPGVFGALEERLRSRHEQRREHAVGEDLPMVVRRLRMARVRFAAWPTEEGAVSRAYGRNPIGDSFDAIGPGLRQTYARARRQMVQADATRSGDDLHRWRKGVKYLRHQMELLEPLWPEVIGGHARALGELGDVLGEDHDLLELLRLLARLPALCPDPVERALLAAIAQHRRSELQRAAFTRGAKVFAEPPAAFATRVGAYWPPGVTGS